MAYNTRRIKKDLDEKPIPQVYNPVTDEYEPLQGSAAGGNRVQLYDGDGNPVGAATDAKLEAARVLLASLDDKDYATQAKQDAAKAVLDAISTAVAARASEATLAQIKTALTDGSQKVQLSGRKVQLDVIANAYSLAAGAGKAWSLGMTTEHDLFIFIDCDKGPWRLTVDGPLGGSYSTDGLYPRREADTATSVGYSKVSRVIMPGGAPANATEAGILAIGAWGISGSIRMVNNHATDTATVTLRALRLWR